MDFTLKQWNFAKDIRDFFGVEMKGKCFFYE